MEWSSPTIKKRERKSGAGDSVSIGKNKKNNSSNNNLKILVSSSATALSDQASIDSDERGSGRKKRSKIARVLKAALFETNLITQVFAPTSRSTTDRREAFEEHRTNMPFEDKEDSRKD